MRKQQRCSVFCRGLAAICCVVSVLFSACPAFAAAPDAAQQTEAYTRYFRDEAQVLSEETEQTILRYNALWDKRYNSVVAVVTVDSIGGAEAEEFAYQAGNELGLGEGDAILLVVVKDGLYYVAPGTEFASILTEPVVAELSGLLTERFAAGEFDAGVTGLFERLDGVYCDNFGLENDSPAQVGVMAANWPARTCLLAVWLTVLAVLVLR